MFYPTHIMRALELAAGWHEGQWRKHPKERIPYIAHPVGVGMMLLKDGWDDETVAAGILHDVIEDCGVTYEQIVEATTARIADLVMAVTEPPKTVSWEERKAAYLERLSSSPEEALAIACADHIYNLHSIIQSSEPSGNFWRVFHVGPSEKLMNEELVLNLMKSRLSSPMVAAFEEAYQQVSALPRPACI